MKKLIAVSALALLALTGCATEGGSLDTPKAPPAPKTIDNGSPWNSYEDKLYVETVKLPDGREVTCILFVNSSENYSYGGPSCDWDNANGIIPEEER